MSLEWNINPSWNILSTASYAFGQNLTANEPLRRIPPFNGKTIIGFNKGNLHLTFEHLYANKQSRLAKGDKEDNRIPQGGTPGWNIFNLVGHYELKNITLRLGLENLLNEDYRMHGSGINGVGRSGWIALELKL
jgi:outer membrane receptor protein involved in Fe transport